MADRKRALARWSEIGVPSPARTRAAASTVSSFQGCPSSACSVAMARIGVAATPPRPMRARVTVPSAMSRANATATLLMSSNGRLAILWNAVVVAAGRGTTTSVISSPGARTDSRYPVKYSLNGTVRVPSAEARTTLASRASRTGGASPIGEPVPRLPPRVAPLRISREANCGNRAASSGRRPRPSRRSISLSVRAAPIRISSSSTDQPRSSSSRSTATTRPARAPLRFTSTPQSVLPATTVAPGSSARILSACWRSVGRMNWASASCSRVGTAAGGVAVRREASRSSAVGKPRAYAASMIGRYPVHRHRLPLSAWRSKPLSPWYASWAAGPEPLVADRPAR